MDGETFNLLHTVLPTEIATMIDAELWAIYRKERSAKLGLDKKVVRYENGSVRIEDRGRFWLDYCEVCGGHLDGTINNFIKDDWEDVIRVPDIMDCTCNR
ncbi:hypothetical protein BNJ_00224 [Kaumoebavirus]|uniref:hypothetical protein n=1 Tax=Kaumoebavirus TaxID=1859492 RepID=UPI0009C1E359|nr:hypothetical protein BNJ_00224 [Kaumoebavirus]ARA72053.1 hypothetical protein BNJ_00224 [Kaumoebavirus]